MSLFRITKVIFIGGIWTFFIMLLVALIKEGSWGGLLILWGTAGVIWFLGNRAKNNQASGASNKTVQPVEITDFHWSDDGNFDFEIVGESFYQKNLKALVGKHEDKGCRVYGTAALVPEDDNPHDNKAVAVYVKTMENQSARQVGHLSRQDARRFRRRLGAKKLTGQRTRCDAVIVGGRVNKKGIRQSYGVWLDMKPFD